MRNRLTSPNSGINLIKSKEKSAKKNSFSLLDILVILSALFVIVFFVYLVINPGKKGAEQRNSQRSSDILAIMTMLSGYVEEEGEVPENIPEGESCLQYGHEICKSGPYDCTDLVNLPYLVEKDSEGEQVVSFPEDPINESSNGTGYYIVHDGEGYITICAPKAERNVQISFEKYMY